MANYKTPGVYVEEIKLFPPSVAQVETAIPAFIGYTQKARSKKDNDLLFVPTEITSLKEYEQHFGKANPEVNIKVTVDSKKDPKNPPEIIATNDDPSNYLMHYSIQAYFANGGGPCYIVSVGDYSGGDVIVQGDLLKGLNEIEKIDEVTLIVYPEGTRMTPTGDYYTLINMTLAQCAKLGDRFTVCDVYIDKDETVDNIKIFREGVSGTADEMKYGAAYYPYLEMGFDYQYEPEKIAVNNDGTETTLKEMEEGNNALFNQIKNYINAINMKLPPSPAIVGIYAQIDSSRGVWKAPANVNVKWAVKPTINITHEGQADLNVDTNAGKSINAIRAFPGRGSAMVWGARTLTGNDNEWRYIPVRRFFNMVEESVKKATFQYVFEPNDSGTWIKIKAMIENFLTLQWRAGALAGSTPEQAYYVKVGLGETMTALDILEGRLYVDIGMAVVRPAEFIILRFMHKMQEA